MTPASHALAIPEMGLWPGLAGLPSGVRLRPSPAAESQTTLVPPLTFRGAGLEAYSRSVPIDDIGGDVADLVPDASGVTAYVADVSGHGLRAGVLMGMVKTAVRYGLLLGRPLPQILEEVNRVLPPLKLPNMFATLAGLHFDGNGSVHYVSAGHVPVLHYRSRRKAVVRHSTSAFPLGLIPGATYTAGRIRCEPGDIFALVTDGVVELGPDPDPSCGLDAIAAVLRTCHAQPLSAIADAIHSAGQTHDDSTVLLLRILPKDRA